MNKKDAYRELCEKKDLPLFMQAWWLDVVAGEKSWDVALVEKDTEIIAALPFVVKKKYGLTMLSMPVLTQNLGPWVNYPMGQKIARRYAFEKEIFQALIADLPVRNGVSLSFSAEQTNWLPFYWAGFSQTTRYSYVIDDISDAKLLWDALHNKVRTDIRKAEKIVVVDEDAEINDFISCHEKVFFRQGLQVPYDMQMVRKLDAAAAERAQRRIFLAKDEQGRVHAGVYIVWDKYRAYYLMGAGDPALRNSGAASLAMWKAICFASTVTKSYDFEGSMLEPIERFFRAFGARQSPYFNISKYGKILTIAHSMKNIAKSFNT